MDVSYGRCVVCDHVMFPVLTQSPCGHAAEVELLPLADVGTVYSWTRAMGEGDGDPVVYAMVDFLDGHLRVTARVVGADRVAIGMPLGVLAADGAGYVLAPLPRRS